MIIIHRKPSIYNKEIFSPHSLSHTYTDSKTKERIRNFMYIFFGILFILLLLFVLINYRRKKCIIKKICSMPNPKKLQLLNEIIQPFGYQYLPYQDIFHSTFNAWQRNFGYTYRYDCFAPFLGMVYDCEPVYFNYDNRTFLIEFWKGQYGINTGAEIGIYCADKIIPPQERHKELFHTVPDEEIPHFSMNLRRTVKQEEQQIADLSMPHWWLAAFRMGCFSRPKDLWADLCIDFPACGMLHAFANALIRMGYDPCSLQICGSQICFSFQCPVTPVPCRFLTKPVRCFVQWNNHLLCRLFLLVTRPFCCTIDRLLYLYHYLPFVFRRCLHLHKCTRKCRKRRKKL